MARTFPIIGVILSLLVFSCRSGPSPSSERAAPESRAEPRGEDVRASRRGDPEPSCPTAGHRPFTGVVERNGANYALRTAERSIDLWAISQQQAVAPHSPDLSAQVGQEVTVCGAFDGSALYEVELVR